ncbi:MAG: DUF1538 domain-containing protein [Clostridia bacterium]|nr:DUF1538 domain-containing protein [Clostridia bacterium]MBR6680179.1 DUF1538 domain-containing protein [Clostridia bacterium]
MSLFKNTILTEKIVESLKSVLPVTFIVLLLLVTIVPVPAAMLVSFLIGAVMLVIGMGLFTLGAETSMTPMGEYVGSEMTKSKKLPLIVFVSLFVGIMITISEPDLQVLAEQVSSIPNFTLVLTVSIGVGIMLVVSMLRIIFKIKLKYLLIFFYAIVFGLLFFVPENFIPMSFDSGGVTTGPMTVPFIMALGVGVASIRSDDGAEDDSFGLVALCSIGPILAVMLLGLIFDVDAQVVSNYGMPDADTSRDITMLFVRDIPHYLKEVAIAVFPIVIFFLVFRLIRGGRGKKGVGKILVGVAYTYVGLVLFLTGVNVGFMPVGNYLGHELAASEFSWIIVPLGMVIGYFIVAAEPAVHVLTKQVEEATSGTIPGKALSLSLSLGVAASVGIAMLRVLTGISILWIIIPGYLIAIVLSFFVPDLFTSVAFDSGGVASGPMTATFLLPFAVGACSAVGGNIVTDAFGVVAMVAMTPLIAIQILGLIYKIKLNKTQKELADTPVEEPVIEEIIITPDSSDDDIIEF